VRRMASAMGKTGYGQYLMRMIDKEG